MSAALSGFSRVSFFAFSYRNCPQGLQHDVYLLASAALENGRIQLVSRRYPTFMTRVSSDKLWKGVTSVSPAGRKRGRGKKVNTRLIKDLDRGRVLGEGPIFSKKSMIWPGLNAPVFRGREVIEQRELLPNPERVAEVLKYRDTVGKFKRLKLAPIERGWSGAKMPGRSIGPPDPVGEETFEGFDTKVLEMKQVFTMTGNLGRKRRVSAFVVTGNGKGLAGYGLGKSPDGKTALRIAKNRAAQKLQYMEIYNNHTIFHDIFAKFYYTKIYMKRKPEGFGLVCHRAIKTICEVIGIKDMYAKVEGSTKNIQNLTKALFTGLANQLTHEQLAEQKKLYVVEFRKERENLPIVLAEPDEVREEVPKDEELDFDMIHSKGRLELARRKYKPFYVEFKSYKKRMKELERYRNQRKRLIEIWAS